MSAVWPNLNHFRLWKVSLLKTRWARPYICLFQTGHEWDPLCKRKSLFAIISSLMYLFVIKIKLSLPSQTVSRIFGLSTSYFTRYTTSLPGRADLGAGPPPSLGKGPENKVARHTSDVPLFKNHVCSTLDSLSRLYSILQQLWSAVDSYLIPGRFLPVFW